VTENPVPGRECRVGRVRRPGPAEAVTWANSGSAKRHLPVPQAVARLQHRPGVALHWPMARSAASRALDRMAAAQARSRTATASRATSAMYRSSAAKASSASPSAVARAASSTLEMVARKALLVTCRPAAPARPVFGACLAAARWGAAAPL
jgi:hypothetical protein